MARKRQRNEWPEECLLSLLSLLSPNFPSPIGPARVRRASAATIPASAEASRRGGGPNALIEEGREKKKEKKWSKDDDDENEREEEEKKDNNNNNNNNRSRGWAKFKCQGPGRRKRPLFFFCYGNTVIYNTDSQWWRWHW